MIPPAKKFANHMIPPAKKFANHMILPAKKFANHMKYSAGKNFAKDIIWFAFANRSTIFDCEGVDVVYIAGRLMLFARKWRKTLFNVVEKVNMLKQISTSISPPWNP